MKLLKNRHYAGAQAGKRAIRRFPYNILVKNKELWYNKKMDYYVYEHSGILSLYFAKKVGNAYTYTASYTLGKWTWEEELYYVLTEDRTVSRLELRLKGIPEYDKA